MRIAFLSYFSGLVDRGAETYVQDLSTQLVNLGHEVTVYQNGTSKNTAYATRYLPSLYFLPEFSPQPDVVIPVNGRVQAIRSRIWTLINRKKLIISGQSGPGADDKLNLYTFPDVFIGLTEFQCLWAKRINPFATIKKIPNGVDLDFFNPQVTPLKINLPRPVILTVAALEPIKRLDLLISAVSQTAASLLIVGNGSLKDKLTDQAEKLLPHRYQIQSYPHSHMPSVYTAADLFAYPTSAFESFGIAMLEAMAANKAVVASADPIRQEIIGNAGLTFDPINTAGFAKTLETALTKKWGEQPRQLAQNYSWINIASQYDKLFSGLCR